MHIATILYAWLPIVLFFGVLYAVTRFALRAPRN